MDAAHILVIEDDDIVARTIERCLRGKDFHITLANSGVEGLQIARRRPPELVILDVIMPGMDGYTVCREMRSDPLLAAVPILFLTAKAKDEDKIAGFTAGADDYLSKPFNMDELILRVRAVLRRTKRQAKAKEEEAGQKNFSLGSLLPKVSTIFQNKKGEEKPAANEEADHSISIQGYTLDTRSYELTTPHQGKIRLTPVQFDLLYHLMSHPGEIFSPTRLLDEVWNYPTDAGSPDLVRVHIKNLRERVEVDPKSPAFIETVPGYGYTIKA
ncbi:MAG: response regulator transcription factor [Chloroflexi bacterium]|jgi:DNA-binding response OmpR family regulator|nr:response regulator transcription factor [Anaerolineaceae bacterium]NMB90544.1 response regulator transcription factor [Chloroflexota bacterium]